MASETDRALYRAAYHAGRSARIAGEPRTACPYPFDYARYWMDGWDDADMDLAARKVACPKCAAHEGEPCRTSWWDAPYTAHAERWARWRSVTREMQADLFAEAV